MSTFVIVIAVLFVTALRYRRVKIRKAERTCLLCQDRGIKGVQVIRRHLRMRLSPPQSFSWRFVSQTQRRCPTENCPAHKQWAEEKYGLPCFSVWRFVFHHGQFKDNAKPEDFVGPLGHSLQKKTVKSKPLVFCHHRWM